MIPAPAVCGIAQLGLDHQSFLGTDLRQIAAEKAGIAKRDVPLITLNYEAPIASVVGEKATLAGAHWLAMGSAWDAAVYRERLHYRDAEGRIDTPLPRLAGPHQPMNAALAFAMLRHQSSVSVSEAALKAAPLWATWPARLQRLTQGPLVDRLGGEDRAIWLDGGHNPAAGEMLGKFFDSARLGETRLTLLTGMLANKDIAGFLAPLRERVAHIHSVPVAGHEHHSHAEFAALAAQWGIGHSAHQDLEAAAATIGTETGGPLLIAGSLYLAGEVLRLNEQYPD